MLGERCWVTALPVGLTLSVPRSLQGRMKLLGAVLLAASLLGTAAREEQSPWPDDPLRTCFFQMLSGVDGEFCRLVTPCCLLAELHQPWVASHVLPLHVTSWDS